VPVVESRPAAIVLETYQKRTIWSDPSHAGFPQGLFDATNLNLIVSHPFVASWLTNAIDQIVKERPHELSKPLTSARHGPARFDLASPRHDLPTPSAGSSAPLAARPGRCLASVYKQGNLNNSPQKADRQFSSQDFFLPAAFSCGHD
jgi:hypothetical protein